MTRRRVADYLAAADLARVQVDRARQEGANDAARAKQLASLTSSVPGLVTSVFDATTKQEQQAKADAQQKIENERAKRGDEIRDSAEKRAQAGFEAQQASDAERRTREQAELEAKQRETSAAKAKAARDEVLKNRIAVAVENGEDPRELASQLRDLEETHDVPTSEVVRLYNEARKAREADANARMDKERDFSLREDAQRDASARGWRALQIQEQDSKTKADNAARERRNIAQEKKENTAMEVENYVANIKDNIALLQKQVEESGTFELLGPESADLERRITNIAVDMAKLQDPGSVAREGEVALVKKGLFPTGMQGLTWTNDTAQKVLKNMLAEIEARRQQAYRVRKLEAPPSTSEKQAPTAEDIKQW